MNTRAALAVLFAAALVLHPRAQALQRSMYVSVLDEAGQPVAGLGPTDFVVREDNNTREILRVDPADEPMQVAVMVDNSQASRNYIRDIRVGVEGFVTDMLSCRSSQPPSGRRFWPMPRPIARRS